MSGRNYLIRRLKLPNSHPQQVSDSDLQAAGTITTIADLAGSAGKQGLAHHQWQVDEVGSALPEATLKLVVPA